MRGRWFGWLLIAMLLAIGATQAQAHGIGTPQLINVPAGPYNVSIWTDPEPLSVEETHVTVAIIDLETEAPVLDARVMVELMWMEDTSLLLTAPATSESATLKIFHEVFFELPQAGEWQVRVLINDSTEVEPFIIAVVPSARINWSLVGVLALGLLLAGWMAWSWFNGAEDNGR